MLQLGIDIGGTSIKLAAIENGRTLWTSQSAFYRRPTTAQLIDALRNTAKDQLTHADCIGLCVPGIYDAQRRAITLSVNVPGLMGIGLDDLLSQALGNKIPKPKIVNDAIATATDLVTTRNLQGRTIAIALGTGVGMGVLDDGVPLEVEGESPGHIGQVDVSLDENPPVGPDGGAGSLEAYIGVAALTDRYGDVATFLRDTKIDDDPIRALVRAIRICHGIYRPDHILLAGGIGVRLHSLISEIKRACDRNLTKIAKGNWTLSAGEHDFHAALGAARLAACGLATHE
ncbi:MAG TPA: ROK family protein [Tepidisphaeraceae bacterium]|jgi:predicted NBD/HSP70 family sugar kinase|nr:ROK family protein [Tepidisphaeraceae bacterium]